MPTFGMFGAALVVLVQVALAVFLISLAIRLVNAVERIDRSVSRAVARYERSSP